MKMQKVLLYAVIAAFTMTVWGCAQKNKGSEIAAEPEPEAVVEAEEEEPEVEEGELTKEETESLLGVACKTLVGKEADDFGLPVELVGAVSAGTEGKLLAKEYDRLYGKNSLTEAEKAERLTKRFTEAAGQYLNSAVSTYDMVTAQKFVYVMRSYNNVLMQRRLESESKGAMKDAVRKEIAAWKEFGDVFAEYAGNCEYLDRWGGSSAGAAYGGDVCRIEEFRSEMLEETLNGKFEAKAGNANEAASDLKKQADERWNGFEEYSKEVEDGMMPKEGYLETLKEMKVQKDAMKKGLDRWLSAREGVASQMGQKAKGYRNQTARVLKEMKKMIEVELH